MAANASSFTVDFLAAKAKTSATIMNATGWKTGHVEPRALGIDSVFFYVLDYQTEWIWCCSVPRDLFLAALTKLVRLDHAQACASCSHIISECANTPKNQTLEPDKENDLGIALSAYISQTKTYALTENATKMNHFAVIRYGSTDRIRPFALKGSTQYLIPVNTVEASLKQVIAMDSKNHPEWIR